MTEIIRDPEKIIDKSFSLIRAAFGPHSYGDDEFTVVTRIAHSTGDTDFAKEVVFSPGAVESGLQALMKGCAVFTDVNMVKVGISKPLLQKFRCNCICHVSDEDVAAKSREKKITRSELAVQKVSAEIEGGIVVVGNAPTALFEVVRLVREGTLNPALIIGFPVGFVGAEESKRELTTVNVPYMTNLSKRGGTPVAVSAINALLNIQNGRG
ncbi:MAG: precorrin-8X methylmutase [Nitrospinota bacterium]